MSARRTTTIRTAILSLSIGTAVMLLGCGLFDRGEGAMESDDGVSVAPPPTVSAISPPVITGDPPAVGAAPVAYDGPSSLEERIFAAPVIARVRLSSVTSTVELGTTYRGMKYIALLEFSFSVLEYLKGAPPAGSGGSGANEIVAVWAAAPFFGTRQEAEVALPAIVAARDTQWDEREAIVFLQQDSQGFLASTQQSDRYYLSWGGSRPMYSPDDNYSIASRHDRLWLPAEAAVGAPSQPGGDLQRFLMDLPPGMKIRGRIRGILPDGSFLLDRPAATGTAPTITLGEMKTRIAAVTAKLDAGDGSEEYRECVQRTYYLGRQERYLREVYPDRVYTGSNISPPHLHQFDSGLPGGTVVHELPEGSNITPGVPFEVWLDGGDASSFRAATPTQDYRVTTTRPLPEGAYKFHFNHRGPYFSRCDGNAVRYEWTVTVTAPEGTLHELFFDPVTVGTAVAADSANGVLKPASFTDANGASATIQRIAWEAGTGESGTVKIKLTPRSGIAGHAVSFIALDGSVSLSLKAKDATVDAANDTLSWAVTPQPWRSGDKLMLRIREAPDCSNGTVVPNPSANAGLVSDCETLLGIKDKLRGTATLDWSADTAITGWNGVTVSGTPGRVTTLNLSDRQLNGVIPAELGGLDSLEVLWLSGNSFTGCIPSALRAVDDNDLGNLGLQYCAAPR